MIEDREIKGAERRDENGERADLYCQDYSGMFAVAAGAMFFIADRRDHFGGTAG